MLTKKQVEQRKFYLGGTDSGAILGVNPYKTPLQVWAEKTGQIEPPDLSDNMKVKLGVKLENFVANLFREETKKDVKFCRKTIFHPKYDFIGANPDYEIPAENAVVEIKTAGLRQAPRWADNEIPPEYFAQVSHYILAGGFKKAYIAVLIGGQDFQIREIERDEALLSDILSKEINFWNEFIIKKEMPAVIDGDKEILSLLYPQAKIDTVIELSDNENRMIETLQSLKIDKKTLESEIEKLENILKSKIKDNEIGKTGLYNIFWKNQTRTGVDIKRLRDIEPAIAEKYKTEQHIRMFKIKKQEQKK